MYHRPGWCKVHPFPSCFDGYFHSICKNYHTSKFHKMIVKHKKQNGRAQTIPIDCITESFKLHKRNRLGTRCGHNVAVFCTINNHKTEFGSKIFEDSSSPISHQESNISFALYQSNHSKTLLYLWTHGEPHNEYTASHTMNTRRATHGIITCRVKKGQSSLPGWTGQSALMAAPQCWSTEDQWSTKQFRFPGRTGTRRPGMQRRYFRSSTYTVALAAWLKQTLQNTVYLTGWPYAIKSDRPGSIPGHTEVLKNVICGLYSFLLGVDGWVQMKQFN